MNADTSSRTVGRAYAGSFIQCRADNLEARTYASTEQKMVSATLSAGPQQFTVYIERNAHALSTAARALREAAESLETIAAECAGQERLDLATVQAALADLGDASERRVYADGN